MREGKKKIHYVPFLAAFILYFTQLLFAQSENRPYYHFKTYSIAEGISSNFVNYVYKDSRGFLWIGTDRGLQRYNGSSFITFRHLNTDSNSIANENIRFITEDKQHDIWITTRDGVTRFNYMNGRFTNYVYAYKNGVKIKIGDVYCFFEDSQKRQWIGAYSGLYLFDRKKQQVIHCPPVKLPGIKEEHFSRVSWIEETSKGEIVFAVYDGLVIIDREGRQQYLPIPMPTIKPINPVPCNKILLLKNYPDEIWITANLNGLFKYDRQSKKWTNYRSGGKLISDYVYTAFEWSDTEWLLGSDNLCFFNHRTGVFTKSFDDNKIRSIYCIHKDSNGNIWFASNIDGLHLLNTSTQLFSSIQYVKGWRQDKIMYYDTSLQTLYSLHIYFTHGITNLNLATNTVTRDSIRAFTRYIKQLNHFIADHNILYLAMNAGMWQYDLRLHRLDSIIYENGSSSSRQATFFNVCKSANKIYFAGKFGRGGPFMYDKLTHTTNDLSLGHEKGNDLLSYSYCLTFSNDILYVGMNSDDSIYAYNEATGKKRGIAIPSNYINEKPARIISLCVDKKQNLWCGTSKNGILVFNIPSQKWLRHIGQETGYFPITSKKLVCDADGTVWCNASEGLYSFNPDNFLFKNYTVDDGLFMDSNFGDLSLLPGHRLAYNNLPGYETSFGIINTTPADTSIQTIPISITNLRVVGNNFLTDTLLDNVQEVTLPPNKNAFSLDYAGVAITDGKILSYSYILENAEKYWHEVGNIQSLSYLNLSPGKYTLRIKCKSRDERILGIERVLYISLLPAWYQTSWFKLMAVIILSALSFLAIRYYLKQQLKKQQAIIEKERALTEERNRIAADMHDDVGAGLSRIRYISSSMQSTSLANDSDIKKIVSLSDEAVEKMNEIIWALNQGNQQLEELIYYTRSQCSEMLNNAGVAFSFEVPEFIPVKIIDWKDCRNIYLLIKEAINNAIKHSGASFISIECSIAGKLQFTIADNGFGFYPEKVKEGGNGLLNYKKRVESLNGTYQLITSPIKGTKIIFTLPINAVS